MVVPAFNEAANIEPLIRRAMAVLSSHCTLWEIIIVDDGSTDATPRLVAALAAHEPRIHLLRHPVNRGYGAALSTGFSAAHLELLFFTDADLQFDLSELGQLLQHIEHYDIVIGFRAVRRDPWYRCLNGWVWGQVVNAAFQLRVRDVNCAFKLFWRQRLDLRDIQSQGAFVNTEFLARSRAAGLRIHQVPVTHHPRRSGQPSGADPRVILRALLELNRLHEQLGAGSSAGRRRLGPE